jgi:sulfur-carrier protein
MATVFIPSQLQSLTGGVRQLEVEGATVRELLDQLKTRFPGLKERFLEGDRLRGNLSVAVDGEVSPLGLMERVGPASEVHFVAAIRGGR